MIAILSLFLMFAMLWTIKALTDWACPPAGRMIDAVRQTATDLLWKSPVQRFGLAATLFGFLILLAVSSTLAAVAEPKRGTLWAMLVLWLLVYGIWRFLRWRAVRRFQPQALPHRERERER